MELGALYGAFEDARATDADEDERFGDRRVDELPPEVATRNWRCVSRGCRVSRPRFSRAFAQ